MLKYFLIIAIFTTSFAEAFESSNPYKSMKYIANKTFERLQKNQKKIKKHPEILKQIVKEELIPFVNIEYAGSLILGNMSKNYVPLQKKCFLKAFQNYLENVYGKILLFYKHQFYRISSLEKSLKDSKKVSIYVHILKRGKKPSINLNFKWKKDENSNNWKFYDIVIEGISIINIIKKEWENTLKTKGIDELTNQLELLSKEPLKFKK